MCEQVSHRDVRAIVAVPCCNVTRDRIVERQHAAFDLLHHHRCCRNNFGERCEIEDCVVGSDWRVAVVGQGSKRLPPLWRTGVADFDHRRGTGALSDRTVENVSCSLEPEVTSRRADDACAQEPANAPRPMAERKSDPFGGLIKLS